MQLSGVILWLYAPVICHSAIQHTRCTSSGASFSTFEYKFSSFCKKTFLDFEPTFLQITGKSMI